MEIMCEVRFNMLDVDKVFGVVEQMIQGYKMFGFMFGGQKGIEGFCVFNKVMDNLNIMESLQFYWEMLDVYIWVQQVIGKDMDLQVFVEVIKYLCVFGKVFSQKFFQNMLFFLILEMGGFDIGMQFCVMFDIFIVDVIIKKLLNEQGWLGLCNDKGGIVDVDKFVQDLIKWINEIIVLVLIKDGVDINNDVEFVQVVSYFVSNCFVKDFIMCVIQGGKIYQCFVEMMDKVVGFEGVGDFGKQDLFIVLDEVKGFFVNFVVVVFLVKVIVEGLNIIVLGVNIFQVVYCDGDFFVKMGMGVGVVGVVFGVYKIWSVIIGFIIVGINLNVVVVFFEVVVLFFKGGGVVGVVVGFVVGVGGIIGVIGVFFGSFVVMIIVGVIVVVVVVGFFGWDVMKEMKKKLYEVYWD